MSALFFSASVFFTATTLSAQTQNPAPQDLPDAPLPAAAPDANAAPMPELTAKIDDSFFQSGSSTSQQPGKAAPQAEDRDRRNPPAQQQRIFGVLANFQTVSAGSTPPPAGWKTDFKIANRQNYDYTSIGFLFVTSGIAYAQDSHPSLSTVNGGDAPFWAYLWRGFLDKTDGTYQGTFLFPALLHQDTRYYAMGTGSKTRRTIHAVSSVVIAHNYSQRPVFNAAGLLGKVGTQAVSTTYYPANSEDFGVLASKFAYACLRQAGFSVLREFSPDLRALMHRHSRSSNATP